MHPMLGTSVSGFFVHLVIFLARCLLTENVEAYDEGNDYGKKGEIENFKDILNQQTRSPQTETANQSLNLFESLQYRRVITGSVQSTSLCLIGIAKPNIIHETSAKLAGKMCYLRGPYCGVVRGQVCDANL